MAGESEVIDEGQRMEEINVEKKRIEEGVSWDERGAKYGQGTGEETGGAAWLLGRPMSQRTKHSARKKSTRCVVG